MSARLRVVSAVAAVAFAAGCDFDALLKKCAEDEQCLIGGNKPVLRFPHNGSGLGALGDQLPLAWSPTRPYLTWEYEGDNSWHFRTQLHQCDPGQSLLECPFPDEKSGGQPNSAVTNWTVEQDLQPGKRYWWRVRACDPSKLGVPCGPWSDPRYFDVGRPEGLRNDFAGSGRTELMVAQIKPSNGGSPETVWMFYGYSNGPSRWGELQVGPPLSSGESYAPLLSGAGDLNGDGYTDLAVGYRVNFATGADAPTPVHVYLGGTAGPTGPITLGPDSDLFGQPVGRAGDVNGDGLSDLAVCQATRKMALVYFGGQFGPSDAVGQVAELVVPNSVQTMPGCAFAELLDVDADGYDDLAVSGPGQLSIFHGREAAGTWSPSLDLPAPPGATAFGSSLAGGDFNGDGHGDLIAAGGDGKAYLFLGGKGWFDGTGTPPPFAFDIGPGTVASAGDLNNDGFADLAVGGKTAGRVRVFLGQADGTMRVGPVFQDSNLPSYALSFAGAGDLNEDTFDDLVVGSTAGAVIYYGGPGDMDIGSSPRPMLPPAGSMQFGTGFAPAY